MLNLWFIYLRPYRVALGLAVIAVCLFGYMAHQQSEISSLASAVKATQNKIDKAELAKKEASKPFDTTKHQKVIQARTVSAEQIGKEIIAVDNTLTAFYKTNAPMPTGAKKDALIAKVKAAQTKNTALTGTAVADQINTWQLNPAWTLKLESVVAYQDTTTLPVVFSMTTKQGKAAGLIYAMYDVNNHKLSNITRHYTVDGLKDAVDVGGE